MKWIKVKKRKFNWCYEQIPYSGPTKSPVACENWICKCGHPLYRHQEWKWRKCWFCDCEKFKYSNNSKCTIECVFQRKLYEVV